MTFGQFLSILAARWRLVLSIVALVVTAAIGVSLALPKQYTATAAIVFDVNPDPVSTVGYGEMVWPAYLATQVEIMQSVRVARRVVEALQMKDDELSRRRWQEATGGQGDFEEWMINVLGRGLVVKLTRDQLCKPAKQLKFAIGDFGMWNSIDQTQRAESHASIVDDGLPGVKTNSCICGDKGIVLEPLVFRRVRHNERSPQRYRVRTEGIFSRH